MERHVRIGPRTDPALPNPAPGNTPPQAGGKGWVLGDFLYSPLMSMFSCRVSKPDRNHSPSIAQGFMSGMQDMILIEQA